MLSVIYSSMQNDAGSCVNIGESGQRRQRPECLLFRASCGLALRPPPGSASIPSAVCCPGKRCRRSSAATPPGCSPPSKSMSSNAGQNDFMRMSI